MNQGVIRCNSKPHAQVVGSRREMLRNEIAYNVSIGFEIKVDPTLNNLLGTPLPLPQKTYSKGSTCIFFQTMTAQQPLRISCGLMITEILALNVLLSTL